MLAALLLTGCDSRSAARDSNPSAAAERLVIEINQALPAERRASQGLAWRAADRPETALRVRSARAAAEELDRLADRLERAQRVLADADPESRRALELLRERARVLPPRDPALRAELATLDPGHAADFTVTPTCSPGSDCRTRGEWLRVLAQARDPARLEAAWMAIHEPAAAHRADFARRVALLNQGARDWGYADAGAHWRAAHEMDPDEFALEIERLWSAAEPLYWQLHCHARRRLAAHYGSQHFGSDGLIPAHLLGHPTQMDWSALHGLLAADGQVPMEPQAQPLATDPRQLLALAGERVSAIGFPALPAALAQRSRLEQRPRTACHPSAWNMDLAGDVRVRLCLPPGEAALRTALHELGHVHYYRAYRHQPPLFQHGASPAFHEAIGDLAALALAHAEAPAQSDSPASGVPHRLLGEALRTLPLLPYVRLLERWRWGVYAGTIDPAGYNRAWWSLKASTQGIAPPLARDPSRFDPGVQFQVLAHVPMAPYFVARFQAFDWYRALCRRGGHLSVLHTCDAATLASATPVLQEAMSEGARRPWTELHARITGNEHIDPTALVEYFLPLSEWLATENAGKGCGP